MKAQVGVEAQFHPFVTSALGGEKRPTSRPVPTAEDSDPTGNRTTAPRISHP